MRTVDILIPNYNSFEAIELCIESIWKYTNTPFSIIVYDDGSTNGVYLEYLRKVHDIGRITLVKGPRRIDHGGAINMLLYCSNADYAMILDNDVEILRAGWLADTLALMDEKTLLAAGIERDYQSARLSYPDWFQSWFMMINMKAYRDSMSVDWEKEFVNKHDPAVAPFIVGRPHYEESDAALLPVGTRLMIKLATDNPSGYKIQPIPEAIQKKFRHHAHVSSIATEDPSDTPEFIEARRRKMTEIRKALERLRAD